jgi:hypothetical protein
MLLSINHVFFFVFARVFFFFFFSIHTHASKNNKEIQLCKNESINYYAIHFFPDHFILDARFLSQVSC